MWIRFLCFVLGHKKELLSDWSPQGIFGLPPLKRTFYCPRCERFLEEVVEERPIEFIER